VRQVAGLSLGDDVRMVCNVARTGGTHPQNIFAFWYKVNSKCADLGTNFVRSGIHTAVLILALLMTHCTADKGTGGRGGEMEEAVCRYDSKQCDILLDLPLRKRLFRIKLYS